LWPFPSIVNKATKPFHALLLQLANFNIANSFAAFNLFV
jgi:hypothetical protein